MSEIILCNRNFSGAAFKNECGIGIELTSSLTCTNPNLLVANQPYILKGGNSAIGSTALGKLSNPEITRNLTSLALSFGGDNLIALSVITSKLQEYNVGLMGASASAYESRVGGFVGAVKNYQLALLEYRQALKSPTKVAARQKAKIAFDKMQNNYKYEVKQVTRQIKSTRGTPLTSFKRGTDIARSSRSITKLNLVNSIQVDNVVKFVKHAKYLGNGLALIDFSSRIGNIKNSYKAGGNWEREMFIESSSFAASVATGSLVVDAGLALLVFVTPFGWMGIAIGGLAVAGGATLASIAVNNEFKNNSGDWYDAIMTVVN